MNGPVAKKRSVCEEENGRVLEQCAKVKGERTRKRGKMKGER